VSGTERPHRTPAAVSATSARRRRLSSKVVMAPVCVAAAILQAAFAGTGSARNYISSHASWT
jgi:hypothetical protein